LLLQATAGNRAVAHAVQRRRAGDERPTTPHVRFGSRGPEVEEVQASLNAAGVTPVLETDQIFGRLTLANVKAFQEMSGLAPDGVVGPLTREALARSNSGGAPTPAGEGTDHRSGTGPPTAQQVAGIQAHLNPATPGGGVMGPWDGAGSDAQAQANRDALAAELTAALEAMVARAHPRAQERQRLRHVPVRDFEGAGNQAKRYVDATYGGLTSAAVLTRAQRHQRASFSFQAGRTLLDTTDPSQYQVDVADTADWMAETGKDAKTATRAHSFDKSRSQQERSFLDTHVLAPFVARHRAQIELMDRYLFATAFGGRVWMAPVIEASTDFPDTPGADGSPSPAERRARWGEWETLVHEYIHTLEHPGFSDATRSRRIMTEGFCEMFTKEVLEQAIPAAKADSDPELRKGVEGSMPDGRPFPGFQPTLVPDYSPGAYAEYLSHAEAVRDQLGAGGRNAVRAAFFTGHVELIGLTPRGAAATPAAAGDDELVAVPEGIRSIGALAVLTGSSEETIRQANGNLPQGAPLPHGMVRVPGVRHHVVVEARDGRERQTEGRAEIADQHGVTEAALERANPGVRWASLTAGQRILVPVH
jgi:peptidoglycan hydrolase-like protein with peptidoglycan-binding domain